MLTTNFSGLEKKDIWSPTTKYSYPFEAVNQVNDMMVSGTEAIRKIADTAQW
jgi:hypothetical protein